jgi:AcrR family transcriptional regulator
VTAKQRRGVRTMERVLDAALACFTARGVYDATIDELATRARASVGSIYHHFGGRDRIAVALYRRCMESLLGSVWAATRRARGARPGVEAIVRSYLRWVAAHRDAARFIYAAAETEFLARSTDELAAFKQRLVAPFLEWIRPHVASGAVVAIPPALYEIVLIGPPAELARRWLSGVPGLEIDRAIEVLPGIVWRALEGRTLGRSNIRR